MSTLRKKIPGIILVGIISLIAFYVNDILKEYINLEALTISIIIGILYNNIVGINLNHEEGIKFSLKTLLKIGIVLLGFKINSKLLIDLGYESLILVIIYITIALILSISLGKIFKVDLKLATLIGVGSSVCGASAIVAVTPSIKANDNQAVIGVSVVSFLGAIGVILYGIIGKYLHMNPLEYGIWSGLSLHGVAHAIAAAFALGSQSGEIGTVIKMTRVIMLVPVSIMLSYIFNKDSGKTISAKFPVYVLFFIIAGILNYLNIIPPNMTMFFTKLSSVLILMSMTAMGLKVDIKNVLKEGTGAFILGTIVFIVLSIGSFGYVVKFI